MPCRRKVTACIAPRIPNAVCGQEHMVRLGSKKGLLPAAENTGRTNSHSGRDQEEKNSCICHEFAITLASYPVL
jgi:hypothetical protein